MDWAWVCSAEATPIDKLKLFNIYADHNMPKLKGN
jgi:hypothetical protein